MSDASAASTAGVVPPGWGRLDLVVRAPRAIVGGEQRSVEVGVRDGRIVAIEALGAGLSGADTMTLAADEVLMPGLVDSHVHVCDPGNSAWEGFESATRAAGAGGITTIVDMPIDSIPPTVDLAGLEAKRRAAEGRCHVDVALWGGVIPGNQDQLGPLLDAGVRGFKCFLADTGDPDFPAVTVGQLEEALAALADRGVPLLVHAESADIATELPVTPGPRYLDYLASRPRRIENVAVGQVIDAARRTGGWAHIVHLSSSDALPAIAAARRDGVRITVETCPHYLTIKAEEVPDGATAFKCSPPIREAVNRDDLWTGLCEGLIDQVVSDHSPSTPEMKRLESGDFADAWGGISSLQLTLPIVWTAASLRGFSLVDVARWMAEKPARLAGLSAKGSIAIGGEADLSVIAPDETFVVDPAALRHRHKVTPYAGRELRGVVRRTLLRGQPVRDDNPAGRLIVAGDDRSSRADVTPTMNLDTLEGTVR